MCRSLNATRVASSLIRPSEAGESRRMPSSMLKADRTSHRGSTFGAPAKARMEARS